MGSLRGGRGNGLPRPSAQLLAQPAQVAGWPPVPSPLFLDHFSIKSLQQFDEFRVQSVVPYLDQGQGHRQGKPPSYLSLFSPKNSYSPPVIWLRSLTGT